MSSYSPEQILYAELDELPLLPLDGLFPVDVSSEPLLPKIMSKTIPIPIYHSHFLIVFFLLIAGRCVAMLP
jgi:hypothetical protein